MVFETAAGLREQIQEEILVIGQAPAPHAPMGVHDFFGVRRRARAVPHAGLALVDQIVRLVVNLEGVDGRIAGEDGRIDKRVEIGSAIAMVAEFGPGRAARS